MQKEIIKVLRYFAYFNYPPTFEEVWMFLSQPITKKNLRVYLTELHKKKKVVIYRSVFQFQRYTLGEYKKISSNYELRITTSKFKVNSVKGFVDILSFFPQIKLVGISGSVAMLNAKDNDDIDIFIITAKKRIWTARFIAIMLAEFTGRRRRRNEKHTQNKICLNMFIDESDLSIPQKKQTFYVAHEVLQMKPQVSQFSTYERFLKANQWVYTYFPNSKFKVQKSKLHTKLRTTPLPFALWAVNLIAEGIESILKKFQLALIRRHTTSEIIGDTQLWFFPADFERKLQKDKMISL